MDISRKDDILFVYFLKNFQFRVYSLNFILLREEL